ncbi:hypothetical protein J6590_036774 [Homalodisca vitripennis]|nr:hypothetical protein J6590_036774 [Homalodisca vitripennis]
MVYKRRDHGMISVTMAELLRGGAKWTTELIVCPGPPPPSRHQVPTTPKEVEGTEDRAPHEHSYQTTGERKLPVMPFVSENIYQMQGNTMPKSAKCFLDLTGARPNSVYVAVSRFQNSTSIEGVVLPE